MCIKLYYRLICYETHENILTVFMRILCSGWNQFWNKIFPWNQNLISIVSQYAAYHSITRPIIALLGISHSVIIYEIKLDISSSQPAWDFLSKAEICKLEITLCNSTKTLTAVHSKNHEPFRRAAGFRGYQR